MCPPADWQEYFHSFAVAISPISLKPAMFLATLITKKIKDKYFQPLFAFVSLCNLLLPSASTVSLITAGLPPLWSLGEAGCHLGSGMRGCSQAFLISRDYDMVIFME